MSISMETPSYYKTLAATYRSPQKCYDRCVSIMEKTFLDRAQVGEYRVDMYDVPEFVDSYSRLSDSAKTSLQTFIRSCGFELSLLEYDGDDFPYASFTVSWENP